MDVLLTQPKLTRKVKGKQEPKNAMKVCITDDVFVDRPTDEKENKRKSTKKGFQNSGREKSKRVTQKEIQSQTEESDSECPLCGEHYGE